jgi:hypothetical protein
MKGNYRYNTTFSLKIHYFSILNDKIGVKKDFLMWKWYLPIILVASFDERACNKVTIEKHSMKED